MFRSTLIVAMGLVLALFVPGLVLLALAVYGGYRLVAR